MTVADMGCVVSVGNTVNTETVAEPAATAPTLQILHWNWLSVSIN